MAFNQWGYEFDGLHTSPESLKPESGVYVIFCKSEGKWSVLDVGESESVRDGVMKHDRADCWSKNCSGGTIYYSATYVTDYSGDIGRSIAQKIRSLNDPPCGND